MVVAQRKLTYMLESGLCSTNNKYNASYSFVKSMNVINSFTTQKLMFSMYLSKLGNRTTQYLWKKGILPQQKNTTCISE